MSSSPARVPGLLAIALLAAVLAAEPAAAAGPADPAEVVDAFHFALKSNDRKGVLELLSANVLVFEQGRMQHSRADYAARHLKEDMEFAARTKRAVTRRATHVVRDSAWVTSVNRITGKVNNRPIDLSTNETMLLQREAGRWRIVHIHWSMSAKSAP